ncbi:glycine C-acetyltransferase [Deinococcus yavapaiensis KR-236]|uniref:Glycine C-acetyltransferase n=2 Tax=Deinococcus TaxID=1298 RepID=A0A318S9S0_9DEIO|nr:aminotransferase class I/II-fold pyridoxal phosphate-dependent enzyme [Deinococcus yavapaiensis]PYE55475.1 glycine C-acetyltransferase [Deinococcus yavapaiensis KR-236]
MTIDEGTQDRALSGSVASYRRTTGRDLLERWTEHYEWLEARSDFGVEPYSKYTASRIAPITEAYNRRGDLLGGGPAINFASQDYLSLSAHPHVLEAAKTAVDLYGVHSAGSAALMGGTHLTQILERRLAQHLRVTDCTVFPTGWGAGYGVVRTLVSPQDHVVMDAIAHACLQEGARAATKNVHLFSNNSFEEAARVLEHVRSQHPDAGILLVTEGVFSMDSTVPNVKAFQALARQHGATLVVDVAHDLGCLGTHGGGVLELQDMLGEVDVVMGSFSKTFASNGGFVATNHKALKLALRYNCGPLTFTNALSPVQAACVLAALDVVQSDEGHERRERLMHNSLHLREALTSSGFEVMGEPSAIVPVVLGSPAQARLMTREVVSLGFLVNLVEYPAVAKNASRWRLQVMADHEQQHVDALVKALGTVRAALHEQRATSSA